MARFCRYVLRTTDVAAARAFYEDLPGARGAEIAPLPPEAKARGAPPHWLGHLGVDDVEAAAAAFAARGAARLGPTRREPGGGEVALVRDPGGAVVALTTPRPAAPRPAVVWHVHDGLDLERARAAYGELFGWRFGERLAVAGAGVYHAFAWGPGGESVGAMSAIGDRAGVHPQWLFHFAAAALEPAVEKVRAAGGLALGPFAVPGGGRVAVCEDAQGAAFALLERRS